MSEEREKLMEPVRDVVAKAFNLPKDEVLPPMDAVGFFTLQYGEHLGIAFKELDNFAATVMMTPEMAKRLVRDLQTAIDKMVRVN
jgi:hypothetical protein